MVETSIPVPLDPVTEHPEDRRLWIGNLDIRVTDDTLFSALGRYCIIKTDMICLEVLTLLSLQKGTDFQFVLLKLLQKYGSIEKFDLLFHQSGPLEGQRRSYAFVTYSTAECAKAAKEELDGKIVGTKALSVNWAQNMGMASASSKEKILLDIPALTGAKNETKLNKAVTIQAIEAKLKNMEATNSFEFEINKTPMSSSNSVLTLQNKVKNKQFNRHKSKPYSSRNLK